jgi:hypothetical protein
VSRIGLFGRRNAERRADERDAHAVGSAPVADRGHVDDRVDIEDARRDGNRVDAKEERLVDRDGDSAVYQAHNADRDAKLDADRNGDGTVSREEAHAAHERTEARLAARERLAAEERMKDRTDTRERHGAATTPVVDSDRDGVDDRVEERAPVEPKWRARASLLATLALMVGLTSVYAALTGRLAPVAVVLGLIGLLLSFGGLSASGKPRVAGGGMAMFALLLSVAGAVLGVLAITGAVPWLDSEVDQVARWRDWLDARMPFMKDW